jgi:CHAT domain-containing protein
MALIYRFAIFLATILPESALAQVAPGGFGTRVNGSALGSCRAGSCLINGGSRSGSNLFHRFSQFDTRGAISDVTIDTHGKQNLIIGVTNQAGTLLNKPLRLASPANLFWLSPGGIWLGSGTRLHNVDSLLLSTASGMRIGGRSFNVFANSPWQANLPDDQPSLNWSAMNPEKVDRGGLSEFASSQSITLDGVEITVANNLLVDATGGDLLTRTGAGTNLQAGHSVIISAHKLDLQGLTITAGSPKGWGFVDVQTHPIGSEQGSIHVDRAMFKGQEIKMTSGTISISNSKLAAPKGLIQLQTTNRGGSPNQLSLFNSSIDVEPYSLEDIKAPLTLRSSQPDKPTSIPRPLIGLISSGSINVRDSKLNASLDLAWLPGDQPFIDETMRHLSEVSGEIALIAGNGGIDVRSSHFTADASHNIAGNIQLKANDKDAFGGIKVADSFISASYGVGQGCIFMNSNDGISIINSLLNSSSNRYPLTDQTGFYDDRAEKWTPYSFLGGYISLTNSSALRPIEIEASQLYSVKNTDGGGLKSALLSTGDTFTIKNGENQDVSVNAGKYGALTAYLEGYQYYYSGGQIRIVSNGGISVNNTELNASSGWPKANQLENTAGLIALVNNGSSGINIRDSSLMAKTGPPLRQVDSFYHPGVILSFNKDGETRFSNAQLDVSSLTTDVQSVSDVKHPTIVISPNTISFEGPTYMSAKPIKNPKDIPDGGIFILARNQSPKLEADPTPVYNYSRFTQEFLQDITYKSFAKLDKILLERLSINQAKPNSTPLESMRIPVNSIPNQSILATPTIQESTRASDQGDSEALLLKAQQRSLEATIEKLGLPTNSGRLYSVQDLQARLLLAQQFNSPTVDPRSKPYPKKPHYNPAILHLQRNEQPTGKSRISAILLSAQGAPITTSIEVAQTDLDRWIRSFQRQLSRRSAQPQLSKDPAQHLSRILIGRLLPSLRQQGITALVMEVDRGLQAIPYAALPIGDSLLGDSYAITLTPSLGLIDLDPAQRSMLSQPNRNRPMLLAGASQFNNGMEPLPMVLQELMAVAQVYPSTLLLNDAFSTASLLDNALSPGLRQLHIATHTDFRPGQTSTGLLYTPKMALSLTELGRHLRSRSSSSPLDLIALSGCVTALGDEQSELGFVGMALQAGARSGLGTLWEVDDTGTAAFFIQFYRYLKLGLAKDQALQATRQAFLHGDVQLQGDRLVGPNELTGSAASTLVSGLSREEQTLFSQGLSHPYYWAGMVLSGSPW